jgi:SAM-dependent methyltransferase
VKVDYDAELRRHDEILRRACRVRAEDHVLDIGCGTGETTRRAARTARTALGVDISAPAIEQARERAEGLDNVTFEHADAQVHRFPPERFDLAMSRFGTMFFADPVAAFSNIRRALRPGGRLVMLVWQARDRNEWSLAIRRALAGPSKPGGPDAFSLADPPAVERILTAAGFGDVGLADVHEPVFYGSDVDAALDWIRGFAGTDEARLDRLHETLRAHLTDDGVWFDSRAWLVTGAAR